MAIISGKNDTLLHMAQFYIVRFQVLTLMMEAVRTSETSVDNHFTRQYIPENNSEHQFYIIKIM
jgi:hypothetical protein